MADHRPDLYGHVEGSWRTAPPPQNVIDQALAIECLDCNCNVFITEAEDRDGFYDITVAHDETCPSLRVWIQRREENK